MPARGVNRHLAAPSRLESFKMSFAVGLALQRAFFRSPIPYALIAAAEPTKSARMIKIRRAEQADITHICALADEVLTAGYTDADYTTFLAAADAYEDYRYAHAPREPWLADAKRKPVWFLVASDDAGQFAGFLLAFGRNAALDAAGRPADLASQRVAEMLGSMIPFATIKQVAVARALQRKGVARALYADLFAAIRNGEPFLNKVFASIVLDPPNQSSEAFHAGLGFMPTFQAQSNVGLPVQVWHRPLTPEITRFRSMTVVAPELPHMLDARTSAERLYMHEDVLNWKKLSILGVILFTQLAALWTICNALIAGVASPHGWHRYFLLVTLFAVAALGVFAVDSGRRALESGRYFMAVHKATARTLEAQIRAISPSFLPAISAVPGSSKTSAILRSLPRQALFISCAAATVSCMLGSVVLLLGR